MRMPFRDRIANCHGLVAAKVVHDNSIIGPKFWCQAVPDIHLEDKPVHGAIHHQGRNNAVVTEAGDKGRGAPVAKGCAACEALSLGTASVASYHVGLGHGLVQEDQAFGIKTVLFSLPLLPGGGHIRPFLFLGENGFL